MKCKVIIVHGSYGHPQENWFPWLKAGLEKDGCEVFVPKFPTPEGQSLDSWMEAFGPYWKRVNRNTVFVGHSLGPAFILSVLGRLEGPVKACFFVEGFTGKFTGKYADKGFDEINRTFAEKEFDWKKIRENCPEFFVYRSDNDPYMPSSKGEELAKKLGVKAKVVKGAGHFNSKAGYDRFPLLLEDILKELGEK